jgi:RimJ/RimL family protein N-acetyltransferase
VRGYDYSEPIRTERLVLRAFEPRDSDAVHAMRSNPDVVRYLYWDVHTKDQARRALEDRIRFRSIHREGDVLALAAVLHGADDMVVDLILRCVSEEHSLGEIGYIVHPAHQGNGYATEAARAVLEKLGMRREAHLVENEWVKGEWQSEVIYAMLAREWRSVG